MSGKATGEERDFGKVRVGKLRMSSDGCAAYLPNFGKHFSNFWVQTLPVCKCKVDDARLIVLGRFSLCSKTWYGGRQLVVIYCTSQVARNFGISERAFPIPARTFARSHSQSSDIILRIRNQKSEYTCTDLIDLVNGPKLSSVPYSIVWLLRKGVCACYSSIPCA